MKREDLIALISDYRVALLIILLVLSVISIGPHIDQNGKFATNLQFGLDLQKGAWLQLEFRAAVVGFETNRPVDEFINDLKKQLETDVVLLGEDKIEVRKLVPRAELEQVFQAAGGTLTTYEQGVSKETADDVKRILENKVNSLGTKDARVNTLTGMNGISRYIRVELAGVSMSQAQSIVGTQGRFEIRVQTSENETAHVLYGDTITSVGRPTQEPPGSGNWGVSFTLSPEGADAFRNAAIQYGATTDPANHELQMLLDTKLVYSAPLSDDLAGKLQIEPTRELLASTGSGAAALTQAQNLEIHLRAGALPVDVQVAGSGSVSAALGEHYLMMSIIAFIFAVLAVGLVVWYRYREPAIVLPMMGINISEIIILLGVARWIQQLDLAAIAALIAVLGTGIDQLVIITDEILHEGRVPSQNLYLKRLTRALGIIMVSAAAVIFAMLPLALMDLSTLRGFAIITILGVLIGVIVTRPSYGRIIMAILSK
ncbi:MAG: preprotein translocase subunit SecD [Methanomicrobiales archaeon]|jgi:preprotein translocase subunit SecD|nr:preprotein translocase subunit SecD [Methanomicrobiales archaeon]